MFESAKWIGSPRRGLHTGKLEHYRIEMAGSVKGGEEAGIVFGGRDKDNYLLLIVNLLQKRAEFTEYTDEAWQGSFDDGHKKSGRSLGVFSPKKAQDSSGLQNGSVGLDRNSADAALTGKIFTLQMTVDHRKVWLSVNGEQYVDGEELIPKNPQNQPRKSELMMFGLKQERPEESTLYEKIEITAADGNTGEEFPILTADKKTGWCQLAALGEVTAEGLLVEMNFQMIDPVPAVTLIKDFDLTQDELGKLDSASLSSTARGLYVCYVNGKRVGEEYLAPGFTEYSLHLDWQEAEIRQHLKAGKNRILAVVGKGYFAGFCGYSGAEVYGKENSFLGQLDLNYKNGKKDRIVTDESWFYTDLGPVQYGEIQDGEYYDARLEEVYDLPVLTPESGIGRDDAACRQHSGSAADVFWKIGRIWEPCGIKEAPADPKPINGTWEEPLHFYMKKQTYPAAKVVDRLLPVNITESPKGHFVYDLGQNMVGTICIRLKGKRGQSFRIRYGEMCYGSGQVYVENLRTAASTDIYVCKGAEEETFLPEFTFHGFRYVEVSGNGYELENADGILKVEGLVLSNVDGLVGDFECSSPLLNRLQKNIQWGQRGNFLLVPTDCPQRNERMGWTGDIQVFAPTAGFNMDVQAFLRKWLLDLREAQLLYNRDGAAPDTAPLGGDNRTDGCGGWGDAAVIVPWELYQEYNDVTILSESYDLMRDWVEYQSRPDRETPEGIQTKQRRGDHLAYDTTTPHELCATAYAARCADLLSQAAEILGRDEDAKKYRARFERVRAAFAAKWFAQDGTCEFPSQTAYALAIDFGLLSGEQMKGAGEGLLNAVKEREYHLSVGFLGIAHLLPALTKSGHEDAAARLLMQEECPGWLYSVKNGATTIWERWNSYIAETHTFGDVNMNSFNHYAYGAVGEWIYREILGIRRIAPGYDELILEPKPVAGLTYAKGYHICRHGKISSDWKIEDGNFVYQCDVPAGCTAEIRLPDGRVKKVSEEGLYFFNVPITNTLHTCVEGSFMKVSDCMDKAKNYMEQLTICSEHNIPAKIVADEHSFFTWDNELRTPSLKPYLFDWSYYNGVVMEGLLDVYETDKEKYIRLYEYVKEYLDALITEDEGGHPVLDRKKAGYVDHHGVDCYKSAVLLEKMTNGQDTYAAIADDLYRDLTSDTYVNSRGDIVSVKYTEESLGGNYWHGWAGGNPPKYKVWLDGIYMIQPFITAHAVRTGDRAQLEKVVKRFEWVATELLSPKGIYYHAANSREDVCDFHWLRATGWYGMAMADVMELLPSEMTAGIRKALKIFVDGMLAFQDESGMWANLADRPVTETNRLETSGTAMMVYTILKAVRLGALDESYQEKAVKAFCAVTELKLRDGKLEDIYMKAAADGTNNYEDPEYYMPDEGKGSGPFLMAYAEMLRRGT